MGVVEVARYLGHVSASYWRSNGHDSELIAYRKSRVLGGKCDSRL